MRMSSMKLRVPALLSSISLLALLALAPAPAAAQDPENVDEATAYQLWFLANGAGETDKALELAKEYVKKYPKGEHADYLAKWAQSAQATAFNEALKAKDMKKVLELGEQRLAEDPNDLNYLLQLAINLRKDDAFAKEAEEYGARAIAAIEQGKTPAGADPAKWKKDDILAGLHHGMGLLASKAGKADEALAHFQQSSKLDPDNAALSAYNALLSASIHKDRYDAAVARYKALPEEERSTTEPSEAAKTAVDEANQELDTALDLWAVFLAKGSGQAAFKDMAAKIQSSANELWAYRHPDDAEGFAALVATKK
jgi:tetratricopeptide (TPR) repeat protein